MLRLSILLLLLANATYFAWSQGLLASWGFAPVQQSEPQRMEQQVRPQALRILGSDEAKRLETAAALAKSQECLQAGVFEDAQVASLKRVIEAWPPGSWSLEPAIDPARWIVYMGKYTNADIVSRKKAELRQLGVSFEALGNSALEPGLSLGGFPTQEQANLQMEALAQRGVHTAKVVQERAELRGQLLKLPTVDDGLRARLDDLKPVLGGKSLRPCR
jgi:hypothetical protein